MEQVICNSAHREPWNEGKLVGQKAPLNLKDTWAIWIGLQLFGHTRDLALFNLAIDTKLRARCRTNDRDATENLASCSV